MGRCEGDIPGQTAGRASTYAIALAASAAHLTALYIGLISPSIMLPPRRLDTLLTHARTYQRSTCSYHQVGTQSETFSLYVDHSCTRAQFPTLTTHILAEHLDEVWRLEWSHDGRYLASASQDKTAIIWRIGVSHLRFSLSLEF